VNVLVTGGGTTAPIDDVRTITNVSTGRFAAAISESCLARGASVWHVYSPAALLPLARLARLDLETTDLHTELIRLRGLHDRWMAVRDRLHLVGLKKGTVTEYSDVLREILVTRPIDVVFLAMAVSDYEPVPLAGKVSSGAEELIVRCRPTPKVIRSVRDWAPSVYLVGFKLLSRVSEAELILRAGELSRASQADLVVANDLQSLVAGQHTVHLVRPGHPPERLGPGPDLADRLVERVLGWARSATSHSSSHPDAGRTSPQ
jgi:phosphopantothenate-cysteine ligase